MPGNIQFIDALSGSFPVDAVYILEKFPPGRVQVIQGNVVCVIGEFEWGPTDVVTAVSTGPDLLDLFGGVGPDAAGNFYKGMLALRAKVSLGPLRVIRISNSTQAKASYTITDGAGSPVNVIKVEARYAGARGNQYTVTTTAATDAVTNHIDITIKRSGTIVAVLRNVDLSAIANAAEFPQSVGNTHVKVTRLALGDGGPAFVADQALTAGSDGTFADADYTGSSLDRGIELLKTAQAEDVRIAFVAEQSSAAINGALLSAAAVANKNMVISGTSAQAKATTKTDVASYRSDRVWYAGTSAMIYLPEANGGLGGLVNVLGNSFLASVVTSIPPGRNPAGPGENGQNLKLLSGVRGLVDQTLGTQDYADFRAKGVVALEVSPLGGFDFRSGVTSSLLTGRKNIARRMIADVIEISGATFLLQFQNQPINNDLKVRIRTAMSSFLDGLAQDGLLPKKIDLKPGLMPYLITFSSTSDEEAQGILKVDLRCRTFATADFILFSCEIGESVTVTAAEVQQAA